MPPIIFTLERILRAVVLALFLAPLLGQCAENTGDSLAALFDSQQAEHIVLVMFKDTSINRIPSTATAYRKRGDYQSSSYSENLSSQIADEYHLQKLTEWPMSSIDMHCVVYQVPQTISMTDTVHNLTHDARIELVQNLQDFTTQTVTTDDPYFKLQTNLQAMQIAQVHAQTTGKKVTIAMIDTGADLDHPDLQGQITQHENFAEAISTSFNTDKHGTAVAGIMVAKKANGTGIIGVAPDAHLLVLKACWPDRTDTMTARCNSFTLALAVDKAINAGANILNMSLAGPKDPLLERLLNKAIENGMIVVAADLGSNKPTENFPASMKNVLAIQSLKPTEVHSHLMAYPLKAPGDKILTTLPYGTYDFTSGCSMATAEVSGIVALLLELKPKLTHAEIKALLKPSATNLASDNLPGIDAHAAVMALCTEMTCPQKTISFALQ